MCVPLFPKLEHISMHHAPSPLPEQTTPTSFSAVQLAGEGGISSKQSLSLPEVRLQSRGGDTLRALPPWYNEPVYHARG